MLRGSTRPSPWLSARHGATDLKGPYLPSRRDPDQTTSLSLGAAQAQDNPTPVVACGVSGLKPTAAGRANCFRQGKVLVATKLDTATTTTIIPAVVALEINVMLGNVCQMASPRMVGM